MLLIDLPHLPQFSEENFSYRGKRLRGVVDEIMKLANKFNAGIKGGVKRTGMELSDLTCR